MNTDERIASAVTGLRRATEQLPSPQRLVRRRTPFVPVAVSAILVAGLVLGALVSQPGRESRMGEVGGPLGTATARPTALPAATAAPSPDTAATPRARGIAPSVAPPSLLQPASAGRPDAALVALGRILFTRDSTLWLMEGDGTAQRALFGGTDGSWSPDGSRIVFTRAEYTSGPSHLWVARVDGSGLLQVTSGDVQDRAATWSPDGRRIAFVRGVRDADGAVYLDERGGGVVPYREELWLVNADGGDAHKLAGPRRSEDRWFSGGPDWSPDGADVLYSDRDQILVISPDGSGRRRIGDISGAGPAWSPDGRFIAYSAYQRTDPPYSNLWIAHSDGSRARQLAPTLTSSDRVSSHGAAGWSSDGSRIVFVRSRGLSAPSGSAIASISIDGTDMRELTARPSGMQDLWPAFEPRPR